MNFRQTILGIFLLTTASLAAQPIPLQLCVVQPSEGLSSGPVGTQPEWGGSEAKGLAKELSIRKLPDGTPIQAIAVVRKHRKDAEDDAQRQDCPFIIELWDHNIGDMANSNAAPVPDGSPTAGIPNGVPYHGDPIDSGVEWAMRRNDSHKVIASGWAPPGVRHRQAVIIPPSIPTIATQITDKLNRIDKH